MDFTIVSVNEICWQFVQSNSSLIAYSHIPTALIALFVSGFIFLKSKRSLSGGVLLAMSIIFSLWSAADLATWMSYDTRLTMFAWAPLGFLYMLIFAFGLYLTYAFFDQQDLSFWKKMAIFAPIVPAIALTNTPFNLEGFDAQNCEAIEAPLFTNFYHLFGVFILAWIAILAIRRYREARLPSERKKIFFFTIGIEFFLISFFITGYIASLIDNFTIGIYGLFGMPIFMALLGYIIVQYRAFNVKALATQTLVVVLIFLIGAQFFYVKTTTNLILTSVTFFLVVIAGWMLMRSFRHSEERKEELQVMADRLAISNDRLREMDETKTEFISIASHQLRTPLTAIRGYCSLMLEGSYGEIDTSAQEVIHRLIFANDRLLYLVENLLSVSRMESGRMEYKMEEYPVEAILSELYESFHFQAEAKNLEFTIHLPEQPLPVLAIDKQKMREVFSNLIDNAFKYTDKGEVSVNVSYDDDTKKIQIRIKDSGIGIPASEIPFLFTKFSRGKDVDRLHANGTGLGLYVAKTIVEAHGGKIWIESEGDGHGTTFIVELG